MKKDPYRQSRYLKDMTVAASQDFAKGISCTSFLVPVPLADSQPQQYLAFGTLEQLVDLLESLTKDLEAEGRKAFLADPAVGCPYELGTKENMAWVDGFNAAFQEDEMTRNAKEE